MTDQQIEWINNPTMAWQWAMEWVNESKNGTHAPVKMIHDAAEKIKDRFCTNGLWAPGAETVYLMLLESADMAQAEYEDSQPSWE